MKISETLQRNFRDAQLVVTKWSNLVPTPESLLLNIKDSLEQPEPRSRLDACSINSKTICNLAIFNALFCSDIVFTYALGRSSISPVQLISYYALLRCGECCALKSGEYFYAKDKIALSALSFGIALACSVGLMPLRLALNAIQIVTIGVFVGIALCISLLFNSMVMALNFHKTAKDLLINKESVVFLHTLAALPGSTMVVAICGGYYGYILVASCMFLQLLSQGMILDFLLKGLNLFGLTDIQDYLKFNQNYLNSNYFPDFLNHARALSAAAK